MACSWRLSRLPYRFRGESSYIGLLNMISVLQYRELIRNLVFKDLKLKYRDSTFGFLWSLANPLLVILVYSFVFGHLIPVGMEQFPYFLMIGILAWNFFAQSLMMSTGSILDNGNLIRKVAVPMEVFPVATVLFNLAQYLLALIVLIPMAFVFFGVLPSWSWLAFFPILVLHVFFTLGACFVVATATVFYRDVRHFTETLLMLLFWLTPIIYDIRSITPPLQSVIYLNPLSFFTLSYQNALYYNLFPSLQEVAVLTMLTALMIVTGYALFVRLKTRFAEEV
jgi:lipopolysaccharide transport system permease protein